MHDWPGRAHVESLRAWPELAQTVDRIEARPDVFSGALLIGSLSRGEGDAISDVDLVAVAHPGPWQDAWEARHFLSSGALVTFDRDEGKPGIAGHSWLTASRMWRRTRARMRRGLTGKAGREQDHGAQGSLQ